MRTGISFAALLAFISFSIAGCSPNKIKTPLAQDIRLAATGTQIVGSLDGTFQVNGNGGADYVMPIEVPPGTHGIDPDLSLTYNSHRGNGYLGVGWALNGISAITRCPATMTQDRFFDGIDFDANDRFCLDGVRLIAVKGPYGQEGTVYRTEKETWTQLTAYGHCGAGPCFFVGQNKDGSYVYFGEVPGGKSDAAIPAQGRSDGAIMVWSIKQYQDTNGNYVSVSYSSNTSTGEYYPTRIDYTGNNGMGATPQRSVQFAYAARNDVITSYVAGSQTQISQVMTDVKTYVGSTMVLDYKLTYNQSPYVGLNRLNSVTKCDASGTCYPPTQFGWQNANFNLASINPNPNLPSGQVSCGLLVSYTCWDGGGETSSWSDFNGDGMADYACDNPVSGGQHWILISKQGKALGSPNTTGNGTVKMNWCTNTTTHADFNGDGLSDLQCQDSGGGVHSVMLSNASTVAPPQGTSASGQVISNWCTGSGKISQIDFNGDGLQDLACDDTKAGNHWVMLSTATGLTSPNGDPNGLMVSSWCGGTGITTWTDVNGDGRSDIACDDATVASHWVMLSTGTALTPFNPPGGNDGDPILSSWCGGKGSSTWTDVNGDGLADIACDDYTSGNHWVMLSTGTTLVPPPGINTPGLFKSSWCQNGFSYWGDFNGDGLSDLHCAKSNGTSPSSTSVIVQSVLLSTGQGLVSPTINNSSGLVFSGVCNDKPSKKTTWCPPPSQWSWADFNGDGLADIFCDDTAPHANGPGDTGNHYVLVQKSPKPDLMNSVTNGLNGNVTITYAPLTDASVYTKGSGSQFPLRDMQTPMYVVKSYVNSDGRGNSYTYQYKYSGAVVDQSGRGWMGFASMTMTDLASGRYSVVSFNQTFPQNGTISQNQVFGSDGKLEGSSSVNYTSVKTASNTNPNGVGADIYQVLPTSEKISIYTDGTLNYTLEKDYQYDAYGNMVLLSDLGDTANDQDDVYSCMIYSNNIPAWQLGYLLEQQVNNTAAACTTFLSATTRSWDPSNSLTWSQRKYYDGSMNVSSEARWDDTYNQWLGSTYTFDGYGNMTQMTDAAQNTTKIQYDTTYSTFPYTVTTPPNAAGKALSISTAYEPNFGQLISRTDANGNIQSNTVDTFGRVIEIYGQDPNGKSVQLGARSWGSDSTGFYSLESKRDQWSDDTQANWYWDKDYIDGLYRNYRSQSTGPTASQALTEDIIFDNQGRVWKESLPYYQGDATAYTVTQYDDHNRPVTVTSSDGIVKNIVYQLGERQVTSTEAFGTDDAQTTTRVVNSRGKTITKTFPNGSVATYEYDKLQRLTQITDPLKMVTKIVYDSLGRPKSVTDPDRGVTTYTYDKQGFYKQQTDAEGQTITYAYDRLGRLVTKTLAPGHNQVIQYTYDESSAANGNGNLTSLSLSDGPSYSYNYNSYNQITNSKVTVAGMMPGVGLAIYSFSQEQDPLGRVTQFTFPDGAVQSNTYTPDGHLQQLSLQDTNGTTTNYATYGNYDALGNVLNTTYGNGVTTRYTYYPITQATGELQNLVTAHGSTTLFDHQYTWNNVNAVTTIGTQNPNPANAQSFTYDSTHMSYLKQAQAQNQGGYPTQNYDYSAVGDITQQNATSYQYDPKNHQIKSGSDGSAFTYYKNGNLKTRTLAGPNLYTYTYDAASQLTGVTQSMGNTNGSVLSFSYDDDGNRILKIDASNSSVTYYLANNFEVMITGASGTQTAQYTKYIDGPFGRVAAITASGTGTPPPSAGIMSSFAKRIPPGVLAKGDLSLLLLPMFVFFMIFLRKWQTEFALAYRRFALLVPLILAAFFGQIGLLEAALTPGQNGAGYPVTGVYYFHQDVLDSTTLITDASGNAVTNIAYLPYGGIDGDRSNGPDIFREKFSGKELDNSVGYYYFGARYYDPSLGQFTAPDPAYQGFSPYRYGGNSPESVIDPDGEFAFLIVALVIGGLVGAYMGGVAVNNGDFNPAHWNWKDGKTYVGIFAGAVIGGIGGLSGAVFAEAGIAAGIAGEVVFGAIEGAAFSAIGGGSAQDVVAAAVEGALFGGVFGLAGAGIGRVGSKLVSNFSRKGGEAVEMGMEEAGAIRKQAEGGCSSFKAGTLIATDDGLRPIETLETGEEVLSYNERTGRAEYRPITRTIQREVPAYLVLYLENEAIEVTPEHPFWRDGEGWVEAKDLKEGDWVFSLDLDRGAEVTATQIKGVEQKEETATVYNFAVEDNHNYFVTADGVLVHNPGYCTNKHLDAFQKKRPSWAAATKRDLYLSQTIKSGPNKGMVRSAIKNSRYTLSPKAKYATKNTGRLITVWNIDHAGALYKDLWKVARYAKGFIDAPTFRAISNYRPNLRIIHVIENTSHAFEPSPANSLAMAKYIIGDRFGIELGRIPKRL